MTIGGEKSWYLHIFWVLMSREWVDFDRSSLTPILRDFSNRKINCEFRLFIIFSLFNTSLRTKGDENLMAKEREVPLYVFGLQGLMANMWLMALVRQINCSNRLTISIGLRFSWDGKPVTRISHGSPTREVVDYAVTLRGWSLQVSHARTSNAEIFVSSWPIRLFNASTVCSYDSNFLRIFSLSFVIVSSFSSTMLLIMLCPLLCFAKKSLRGPDVV